MSEKQMEVPKGYMRDARGNLVSKKNIKALDLKRDALVKRLSHKAQSLRTAQEEFRREALEGIAALVKESAEAHDVHLGGKKGNVVLTSFDGEVRVLRAIGERINFTEELEVARSLVHECVHEFAKGASRNLKALVENAFAIDDRGKVSVGKILGLQKVNIEHEKWKKAMDIIGQSMQVAYSKEYVRFYKRTAEGDYERVNMNFSG